MRSFLRIFGPLKLHNNKEGKTQNNTKKTMKIRKLIYKIGKLKTRDPDYDNKRLRFIIIKKKLANE